ncbi:type II toxin-antitoxin system RelE/ParE family toxin [Robiginitomaculum antarcticum]|uniref:type II toxin-antitoxin system RelE/ParE family toxin n=1 Tax=Robiginitomaculum antarcticum TaxID=437507 RepID=UPI0003824C44
MKIVYRRSALRDLQNIRNYYAAISLKTADNIRIDIYETIDVLKAFPDSGRPLYDGSRLFPTQKYRFNITYVHKKDNMEIVGIFRFQNRNFS